MRPWMLLALASLLATQLACESTTGDTDALQTQEEDIAQLEQLIVDLQQNRSDFLSKAAMYVSSNGDELFWLNFHSSWDPTLHRWKGSGTGDDNNVALLELDGDGYSYSTTSSMAVSAIPDGGNVRYAAVKLDGSGLGDLTTDKPPYGKWWAYTADQGTGYLVRDEETGVRLQKWTPGGNLRDVANFADWGGTVGEFWQFGVKGDTMIYVESGRVWHVDLVAGEATWLGNEKELNGAITFTDTDAVYATAAGILHYDFTTGTERNLSDEINNASYQLNGTFSSAHQISGNDFDRLGSKIIYQANQGIFGYDMDSGEVQPLILDTRGPDLFIKYRYPVVLDSGVLFVTGLESTSGATGAEGPTWRIDHPWLE